MTPWKRKPAPASSTPLLVGLLVVAVVAVPVTGRAATFTVTTTADAGPGSLRQAITDANNAVGPDTIDFAITGGGVHTITPATQLPTISDAVTINGYSQPGASANTLAAGDNATLLIELDGSGGIGLGLDLASGADGSTIRGLVVDRVSGTGINVQQVTNCVLAGNFIGTDPTGTIARPNTSHGIAISTATTNVIGGTTPAARNVIAGNGNAGIDMEGGADDNTIEGNFIGVDATGAVAVPNGGDGMRIVGAVGNQIGGTTSGARNVISGNGDDGISLQGGANGNVVQGNFFGTDATGTKAVGNAFDAFFIANSANNVIGGTTPGAGNVVSGNRNGVDLLSAGTTGCVVQGNLIGTDVSGTSALGNSGTGVVVQDATGNTIGGTTTGAGNVIAHNAGSGVGLVDNVTTGNRILGNDIFDNGGLGIDLALDGVTQNDAGDGDGGPNDSQNFPVLATPIFSGGTSVMGTLNSRPGHSYRIEVFANAACNPSGNGEGETFVGAVDTGVTDANGDVAFTVSFGQTIGATTLTATATDLATNDTSEFSACPSPPTTTSTTSTTTTSSTTTIASSTTTSTTTTTAAPTTTTAAPVTTTTSPPPPTTTTLPGSECSSVPDGPSFASILCRVEALRARVDAEPGLAAFQSKLAATLTKADDRGVAARDACAGTDAKHAKQRLKQVLRAVTQYAHRLNGLPARKKLDPTLRTDLLAPAPGLEQDVRTLRGGLRCPADVTLGRAVAISV